MTLFSPPPLQLGGSRVPLGSDIFQTEWQQTDPDGSFLREFECTGVSALRRLEETADTKRGMASQQQKSGELPRQGAFHHRGDLALSLGTTLLLPSCPTAQRLGKGRGLQLPVAPQLNMRPVRNSMGEKLKQLSPPFSGL